MTTIRNFLQNLLISIPNIGVSDILDILVVTLLFYTVLRLIRSTSTARVAKAILLLLAATLLTDLAKMYVLNWLLSRVLELGFLALVIIFQPELRRALEKVGGNLLLRLNDPSANLPAEEQAISATVAACEVMARERVGALIVFARAMPLDEYIKGGTTVDARVSEQLLRNLFFKNSPLHDGAVIIRQGRVAAAGCLLPNTQNEHLPSELGTRHRAGIGMSEATDAVVVIISEETGTISVANGGMLKRHLAPQTLEKLLRSELLPSEDAGSRSFIGRIRKWLDKRQKQYEK